MPGHAHKIDSSILNSLDLRQRDAASEIINNHTLSEIVSWNENKIPCEKIIDSHLSINKTSWERVLRRALLIKISYFEVNSLFSLETLEYLYCLAKKAMNYKSNSVNEFIKLNISLGYLYMAKWIKDCAYLIKIKLEEKKTKISNNIN